MFIIQSWHPRWYLEGNWVNSDEATYKANQQDIFNTVKIQMIDEINVR